MHIRPFSIAAIFAVVLAARANAATADAAFDYVPLTVAPAVLQERRLDGALVRDVAIPGAGGGSARAYVVAPPGQGPFGGVLFVHRHGESDEVSNRTEFLDDAIELARHGIVSVLPDAMWSAPHGYAIVRDDAIDDARSIAQVKDLRRALDVLLLQKGIDRRAIAYVGHDFGATYGALLAGVDGRARYYVFMAATASSIDPVLFLRQARIEDALFQFARHDPYVPPAKLAAFYVADRGKKRLRLYDAGHDLEIQPAIDERRAWLIERLSRHPIPSEAAWIR